MPDPVLYQIKFLCKNIPKEEWSGVLFYTVSGSITQPENFEVELKDILPLDKGTSGSTSYNLDDRLVDYMMDNPGSQDWKIGHIHSHHTMKVYFSSTDMDELKDNSASHNYYLSLIVNNSMDFEAKIAFRSKCKVHTRITKEAEFALNENGEEYILNPSITNDKTEEIEKMLVYDCEILNTTEVIDVSESFSTKVKDIINTAAKKKATKTTHYSSKHNSFHNPHVPITRSFFEDEDQVDFFVNPVENGLVPNTEELEEIEAMIIAVIKGSNPPIKGETLESVIVEACIGNDSIGSDELKERFSTYLVSMYEKYITNADTTDIGRFEFIIEEVTDILVEYQTPYPFLTQSVTFLKSLINQLNTDAVTN